MFLQAVGDNPDATMQLFNLGVAGVVIVAMFVAGRLMWTRLQMVTDRFLAHLEGKDERSASAMRDVAATLAEVHHSMKESESLQLERHKQVVELINRLANKDRQ